MKHIQKEIERVCWEHLQKLAGNDKHKVSLDVNGPSLVILDNGPCNGWNIAVGIESDLIGTPAIVSCISVGGVRPLDEHFQQGVALVLEDARKERDRQVNVPQPMPGINAIPVPTPEAPRPQRPPRQRESHFASKPGSEKSLAEAKADVLP